MNKITIHLGSGDDTAGIIRGLWDLAGGDRSRVRTSSSGIVVDPELAYQFLAVVLGKTEPAAPEPEPEPEPEPIVRPVSPDPVQWIAPSDVVYLADLPGAEPPGPAPEHPPVPQTVAVPEPAPQPPAPDGDVTAEPDAPEPTPAAVQPQKPARAPRTPPRKSAPRNR